jgi:hypothetical protein
VHSVLADKNLGLTKNHCQKYMVVNICMVNIWSWWRWGCQKFTFWGTFVNKPLNIRGSEGHRGIFFSSPRYSGVTRRYSTLLDATRRYSTLLDATRRYSTLLDATRRYSTVLDATRLYSTLLDATRRYSTLLDATRRYLTLLDATRR